MKKEKEKPSGLELIVSFVLTFFCIAVVFSLSAFFVWYYTRSITNAFVIFVVGIVIASVSASVRFWIMDNW